MIGRITKRAWVRGLMKVDIKADGQRRKINKSLRSCGLRCTLDNQMALAMGFTSTLR